VALACFNVKIKSFQNYTAATIIFIVKLYLIFHQRYYIYSVKSFLS